MKFTKAQLKPYLLEHLVAGRETAAAPLQPETLRARLTEAAKLGFGECRVRPTMPVDIRNTAAASDAEKFLKRIELEFRWESQTIPPDNVAGASGDYYVLVVQLK